MQGYVESQLHDDEDAVTLNVLSFHLGLGLRIHERRRVEADEDEREFAEGAWQPYSQAVEAMNSTNDAEDFQAVGVKCREALLALARENRDAPWLGDVPTRRRVTTSRDGRRVTTSRDG